MQIKKKKKIDFLRDNTPTMAVLLSDAASIAGLFDRCEQASCHVSLVTVPNDIRKH
jgi:hypothetical protein